MVWLTREASRPRASPTAVSRSSTCGRALARRCRAASLPPAHPGRAPRQQKFGAEPRNCWRML
eukprot:11187506-Lingulodinium_polyedra.AAC.1